MLNVKFIFAKYLRFFTGTLRGGLRSAPRSPQVTDELNYHKADFGRNGTKFPRCSVPRGTPANDMREGPHSPGGGAAASPGRALSERRPRAPPPRLWGLWVTLSKSTARKKGGPQSPVGGAETGHFWWEKEQPRQEPPAEFDRRCVVRSGTRWASLTSGGDGGGYYSVARGAGLIPTESRRLVACPPPSPTDPPPQEMH